ncbi:MAG TPA: MbtH family NRPS accessory protein [Candidatus Stackebrandtia faecavium]|nr:MbtH family NRPS accessory protein [Candidatus Stackebrandtia faecavium]
MTNVFERTDKEHVVLRNDEEQYCLWPASFAVPQGWTVAFGPAHRDDCTAMIRETWTDMRPRSLREAMESAR